MQILNSFRWLNIWKYSKLASGHYPHKQLFGVKIISTTAQQRIFVHLVSLVSVTFTSSFSPSSRMTAHEMHPLFLLSNDPTWMSGGSHQFIARGRLQAQMEQRLKLSQTHYLLASCLTSMMLTFLIYQVGIIIPTLPSYCKNQS